MNPLSAPCHTITVDTGAFSSDGSASILDAALAQGAQVPFSCQRGECGSCRATVLEGRYERIAPANERLCHRRRRAADVPVPRGQRPAPGLSALAGAGPAARAAPRARGVAPAAGAGRDAARRRTGGRAALRLAAGTARSCCWKTAAGATSPSPTYRSPPPDSLLRSLQLRSPQLRARASSATMSGDSASHVAERDASGRSGWSSTSAACPAASSPTASCRAWRRAMR